MNNKQFGVVVFSIAFGVTCFIWGVLMGVIAKDLRDSVIVLEEEKERLELEITQLKWELEQVDQMICIDEVE